MMRQHQSGRPNTRICNEMDDSIPNKQKKMFIL